MVCPRIAVRVGLVVAFMALSGFCSAAVPESRDAAVLPAAAPPVAAAFAPAPGGEMAAPVAAVAPAATTPPPPAPVRPESIIVVFPPKASLPEAANLPSGCVVGPDRITLPPGEELPAALRRLPGAVVQVAGTHPAAGDDPLWKTMGRLVVTFSKKELVPIASLPGGTIVQGSRIMLPPGALLPQALCGMTESKVTARAVKVLPAEKADEGPPRIDMSTWADCLEVPDHWRNPDGSLNQRAVVESQKKHLSTYNRQPGLGLRLSESEHFLFFSNLDATKTAQVRDLAESLHRAVADGLGMGPGVRTWDGKCLVVLFAKRGQLSDCRQYEHLVGIAGGAALMRIQETPSGWEDRDFMHSLTLNISSGMLMRFMDSRPLPQWVQAGFLKGIWYREDPQKAASAWREVLQGVAVSETVRQYFAVGAEDDMRQGEHDYAIVDYLLKVGPGKFGKFLLQLKEGCDQDAALKAVYGFDRAGLLSRWRDYAIALAKSRGIDPNTPPLREFRKLS